MPRKRELTALLWLALTENWVVGFVMMPQPRSLTRIGATMEEASPPQTMAQCLTQASEAVKAALAEDVKLMEVEFPPLPAEQLEAAETSAYDVSKANTQLAVSLSRSLASDGLKVAIVYPDIPEMERAIEDYGSAEPATGVTFHSIRKSFLTAEPGVDMFLAMFGQGKSTIAAVPEVDCYICLTFSAQELPDIETLCELENFTKPVITFNLKLDTLRGDLGLPAFPSKDLQWRFLSRIKPVYYLRTRQYSLSIPQPPFVVNYQGAIFRQYPGSFQSLLDAGSKYRAVAVDTERPALGTFKQQITDALQLPTTQGEAQRLVRFGLKTMTWWEEDSDNNELSKDWRL